ncbi:MAG TPA: hypothetical protein VMH27_16595 [Puia sp.]|nr:hypothetical protein [Puia sp.]
MNRSLPIQLFLALLLIQGLRVSGQIPVFGVYFCADTRYSPGHGGGIVPLAPHTWLYANDKLMMPDNIAELTLFTRDTCYIRLLGKGNYTVAEIEKRPRIPIRDTMMIRYYSFFWQEKIKPAPFVTRNMVNSSGNTSRSPNATPFIFDPRPHYATSLDSIVFRWPNVSWARKYFLRLRGPDGHLVYDSVLTDTQTTVHFPGRMPMGNTYGWALDIVGEGGRLQFADSGHIALVDESKVLPQLPPVPIDSLGGMATILREIERDENAGCTRQAEALLFRLYSDFPRMPRWTNYTPPLDKGIISKLAILAVAAPPPAPYNRTAICGTSPAQNAIR